jgi:hypothetical protein
MSHQWQTVTARRWYDALYRGDEEREGKGAHSQDRRRHNRGGSRHSAYWEERGAPLWSERDADEAVMAESVGRDPGPLTISEVRTGDPRTPRDDSICEWLLEPRNRPSAYHTRGMRRVGESYVHDTAHGEPWHSVGPDPARGHTPGELWGRELFSGDGLEMSQLYAIQASSLPLVLGRDRDREDVPTHPRSAIHRSHHHHSHSHHGHHGHHTAVDLSASVHTHEVRSSHDRQLPMQRPGAGSSPHYSGASSATPFATKLELLREQELELLARKREEELERLRGPEANWFERRDPGFHRECSINTAVTSNAPRAFNRQQYKDALLSLKILK